MTFIDNSYNIDRAIRRAINASLRDAGDHFVQKATEKVPIKTGDLQRSLYADKVNQTSTGFDIEIGAASDHAAAIEWGTASRGEPFTPGDGVDYSFWPTTPPGKRTWKPYPIYPKHGKYLRWVDGSGQQHFARYVIHPGIEPQPFARPSLDALRLGDFKSIVAARVRSELGKFKDNR